MRLLILVHRYAPQPSAAGVSMATWSLAVSALRKGHLVNVGVVLDDATRDEAYVAERLRDLEILGVEASVISLPDSRPRSRLKQLTRAIVSAVVPSTSELYPLVRATERLTAFVHESRADAVVGYPAVIAAVDPASAARRICTLWDIDEDVLGSWFRHTGVRRPATKAIYLFRWLGAIRARDWFLALLRRCDCVIAHSAHSQTWLEGHGVESQYLPSPVVPDPGASDVPPAASSTRKKVLMPGHLSGIATLSGLRLFAEEILPRFKREAVADVEFHIVGRGDVPKDLRRRLDDSRVRIRGFVDDIAAEFRSADIVLVPTPAWVGVRTRIIEAFAYGRCVVAHSANSGGIPELVDETAGLVADTGAGITRKLIQALDDSDLRRHLGENGRRVFERVYEGASAADRLVHAIQACSRDSRTG